eukprot:NODE_78_length_3446_cov_26.808949_g70_i0.p1 GENE.NODE_78_length_3446_cov_26.808949_g70_i0~~NODE_78_length_3446_cov_26.808949_g70_i0.p1  ORF type:complete len:1065 (-),score=214.53 NODE_78_length_3446_cov_26.808949_g70_i0:252-3059(-)
MEDRMMNRLPGYQTYYTVLQRNVEKLQQVQGKRSTAIDRAYNRWCQQLDTALLCRVFCAWRMGAKTAKCMSYISKSMAAVFKKQIQGTVRMCFDALKSNAFLRKRSPGDDDASDCSERRRAELLHMRDQQLAAFRRLACRAGREALFLDEKYFGQYFLPLNDNDCHCHGPQASPRRGRLNLVENDPHAERIRRQDEERREAETRMREIKMRDCTRNSMLYTWWRQQLQTAYIAQELANQQLDPSTSAGQEAMATIAQHEVVSKEGEAVPYPLSDPRHYIALFHWLNPLTCPPLTALRDDERGDQWLCATRVCNLSGILFGSDVTVREEDIVHENEPVLMCLIARAQLYQATRAWESTQGDDKFEAHESVGEILSRSIAARRLSSASALEVETVDEETQTDCGPEEMLLQDITTVPTHQVVTQFLESLGDEWPPAGDVQETDMYMDPTTCSHVLSVLKQRLRQFAKGVGGFLDAKPNDDLIAPDEDLVERLQSFRAQSPRRAPSLMLVKVADMLVSSDDPSVEFALLNAQLKRNWPTLERIYEYYGSLHAGSGALVLSEFLAVLTDAQVLTKKRLPKSAAVNIFMRAAMPSDAAAAELAAMDLSPSLRGLLQQHDVELPNAVSAKGTEPKEPKEKAVTLKSRRRVSTYSSVEEEHCDHELAVLGFAEAMIRVAADARVIAHEPARALPERLRHFFDTFVVPNAIQSDMDSFRFLVSGPPIRNVFVSCKRALGKIFARYSKSGRQIGHEGWMELLRDCKLIDVTMNLQAATMVFNTCKFHSESKAMNWSDFLDAVAAVATLRNPAPWLTLPYKIKHFVDDVLYPGLRNKVMFTASTGEDVMALSPAPSTSDKSQWSSVVKSLRSASVVEELADLRSARRRRSVAVDEMRTKRPTSRRGSKLIHQDQPSQGDPTSANSGISQLDILAPEGVETRVSPA